MEYKKIIMDNVNGSEASFLGILHERAVWSIKHFLILFDAISFASAIDVTGKIDLLPAVNKINSYILNSIINHADKNDDFIIENYETTDIYSCLERLNSVVQGFYECSSVKESWFEDNLRTS